MKNIIGSQLKELRGKLSQAEMASKLGTKQTTYSAWERNENEPDLNSLCAIAKQFSVTTDWLLGMSTASANRSASVAEDHSNYRVSSNCRGCAERDRRIDQLIDILHKSSLGGSSPPVPYGQS